jgi:hypothetical protein
METGQTLQFTRLHFSEIIQSLAPAKVQSPLCLVRLWISLYLTQHFFCASRAHIVELQESLDSQPHIQDYRPGVH